MKVTILKAFSYAHDGYTVRDLAPSDRDPPDAVEIRDDLIAGLEAAGYISTGQGVGRVLQQAATDQAPLDGSHTDDRAGPVEGVPEAGARTADAEDGAALTEIPADWKSKHWKQRVALAKTLGWVDGEPTTEQADGWIADILVHRERAAPREDLGGLSLQEVHATLTAAGVEWDADTSPADLLELYELAKAEKAGA